MKTPFMKVQWFGATTANSRAVNSGNRMTIGAYSRPAVTPKDGDVIELHRPDGTMIRTKVEAVLESGSTYAIVLPGLLMREDVPRGSIAWLLSNED
jgi:hypothetical protein